VGGSHRKKRRKTSKEMAGESFWVRFEEGCWEEGADEEKRSEGGEGDFGEAWQQEKNGESSTMINPKKERSYIDEEKVRGLGKCKHTEGPLIGFR